MKKWEYEAISEAVDGEHRGFLVEWPELGEALINNGLPLLPATPMRAVREICRLILAERKTTDAHLDVYVRSGASAKELQFMLLDREIYASLSDVAQCYRDYCESFACSGWIELSYWDETDDHIGPVDYIAARINVKPA